MIYFDCLHVLNNSIMQKNEFFFNFQVKKTLFSNNYPLNYVKHRI